MRRLGCNSNKGLTLVELIVVLAIISILTGIVVPKMGTIVDQAKDTKLLADLCLLDTVIMVYYSDHNAYPVKLADLVPDYIHLEPQDALGQAFYYLVDEDGNGYVLKGKNTCNQDVQSEASQ